MRRKSRKMINDCSLYLESRSPWQEKLLLALWRDTYQLCGLR